MSSAWWSTCSRAIPWSIPWKNQAAAPSPSPNTTTKMRLNLVSSRMAPPQVDRSVSGAATDARKALRSVASADLASHDLVELRRRSRPDARPLHDDARDGTDVGGEVTLDALEGRGIPLHPRRRSRRGRPRRRIRRQQRLPLRLGGREAREVLDQLLDRGGTGARLPEEDRRERPEQGQGPLLDGLEDDGVDGRARARRWPAGGAGSRSADPAGRRRESEPSRSRSSERPSAGSSSSRVGARHAASRWWCRPRRGTAAAAPASRRRSRADPPGDGASARMTRASSSRDTGRDRLSLGRGGGPVSCIRASWTGVRGGNGSFPVSIS